MKYIKKFESHLFPIRVGDVVKCVESSKTLKKGKFYIIKSVVFDDDEYYVTVEGNNNSYSTRRFKSLTPEEMEQHKFEQNVKKYNL